MAALRTGLALVLALVLVMGTVVLGGLDSARAAEGSRAFGPIFHTQTNGAIAITGNSLLSCGRNPMCSAVLDGTADSTISNNNDWPMVPLDRDSDPSTRSSSSADLDLPAGASILFAGLFWGSNEPVPPDGDPSLLKFKVPGGDYREVKAQRHDRMPGQESFSYVHASYLDVTSAVQAAGNGTYWAADIVARQGKHQFAGWSLVVAYADADAPPRDLTVFNGYQHVDTGKQVDVELSGFRTPPRGPVNARFGMVTYEGDAGYDGDFFAVDGRKLSDATSGADNFFASSVSAGGKTLTNRDLPSANTLGLDAKVVDAPDVLPNDATSTTLTFGTQRDIYYPVALATEIDLYAPVIKGTKSVRNLSGGDDVNPGDTLEYTVDFANSGDDDAIDAVISDELPANTTFVPGSLRVTGGGNDGTKTDRSGDDQAEYDEAGRTVTARVGTGATETAGGRVGADSKASATFQVTVDAGAAGTTLSNVAELAYRAETINKPLTATTPPTETEVTRSANLVITKKSFGSMGSRGADPIAGQLAHYRLTLRNDGPATARDVRVRDVLPEGFSDVTSQPSAGGCEVADRTVDCDLGDLRAGESATISVSGTLAAGSTGKLKNTATVTSPDDPTPATDTVETTIKTQADLAMIKTAESQPGPAGGPITYLLTVRNFGPSTARAVTIADPVPAPLTVDSVTSSAGSCSETSGEVTCQIDEIEPGDEVTVRVQATVPRDRPNNLENTATVSSETPENDPSDNTATYTLIKEAAPELSVIKRADREEVVAGERISYELVVGNGGQADATGVTLTDQLPKALQAAEVSDSQNSCRIEDRTVTCTRDSLPAGDSFTVKITGDIDPDTPAGPLSNTATVDADGDDDPTASDDTSTSTVEVRTRANLGVTKSGPETVRAGEPIEYELRVTNYGPSAAQDVIVADALPPGVRFVGGFSGHGDCELIEDTESAVVGCPLGRIAVGRSRLITLYGEVDAGQPAGSVINEAHVWSPTPDLDQDNNTDTVKTEITRKPSSADLQLTKIANVSTVRPGEQVTFQLTATNHGPDPASEIVITDTVPAGLNVLGGPSEDADCTLHSGEISCTVDELASGASAVIDIVTMLDQDYGGESISNTAKVTTPVPDPADDNNTSTVEVAVESDPLPSPEPPSPEPPSPEPPSPEPPSPDPPSPEPPSPEPPSPEPPGPPSSEPPSPGPSDPPASDDPSDPSGPASPDDSGTPSASADPGPSDETSGPVAPADPENPDPRDDTGDADHPTDPSHDGLPSTGAEIGIGPIAAAIGMLLLGAAVLIVARYRRRH